MFAGPLMFLLLLVTLFPGGFLCKACILVRLDLCLVTKYFESEQISYGHSLYLALSTKQIMLAGL